MSNIDREEIHRLEDIKEAIEKIQGHQRHPEGRSALDGDEQYRVWVYYFIERIGECVSKLRRDFSYDTEYPEIDWRGAQAMRRYLVHKYWKADNDEVWKGVEYLPKILKKVEEIIEQKHAGGTPP